MLTVEERARAATVQADSLIPQQCPTTMAFKRSCDFRAYATVKHPGISEFHSLHEYLLSGLLEGNPAVDTYVPQPFRLKINGRRYTPDFYIHERTGNKKVIELKPRGEFDEARKAILEAFFRLHHMTFEVWSNEDVLQRSQEAENWITIVHVLHRARVMDTTNEELDIVARYYQHPDTPLSLSEFIDPGHREQTFLTELALLRLLHQGQLQANLTRASLDFDTEITLCK